MGLEWDVCRETLSLSLSLSLSLPPSLSLSLPPSLSLSLSLALSLSLSHSPRVLAWPQAVLGGLERLRSLGESARQACRRAPAVGVRVGLGWGRSGNPSAWSARFCTSYSLGVLHSCILSAFRQHGPVKADYSHLERGKQGGRGVEARNESRCLGSRRRLTLDREEEVKPRRLVGKIESTSLLIYSATWAVWQNKWESVTSAKQWNLTTCTTCLHSCLVLSGSSKCAPYHPGGTRTGSERHQTRA